MKKQSSTIFSVIALLAIFVVVMFITMTATTEADEGFQLTDSEEQAIYEYYHTCPFKKAEMDDLTAEHSIREYVEFKDVYCDEEKKTERVVVRFTGNNKELSNQQFQNWLTKQNLNPSEKLQIIIEQ